LRAVRPDTILRRRAMNVRVLEEHEPSASSE
jgi:hypothetical protein